MPQTLTRTDLATGATESMSFAYDGSMTTGVTFAGTVNGSIGLTFDNNFWVTSESVNGDAINLSYDNDGRLKTVGDLTITRNNQNGFLTGTALGSIVDSYAFSTFGETTSYNAKVGASSVFDVQYTRDAIGRIVTKTETVGGATTVYEYSYDAAGRLIAVKENGVTVSTYDYDANGNRITAVTKAGTFQGFYDLQDRMTRYGDADYTYTANGELKTKTDATGISTYNYDVFGNLRGAIMPDGTSVEYIIDASNRRIGKKVNGALVQGFIYKDQLEPIAELDGAGNVVARFVYASKGHVPDYMIKGGVIYRIISDHLGSVRLVVKASDGSIAQRIDYDEFGNVVTDSNPGFQPFALAGGIYDQHTQLTRFGARDYDAITGRWTSKDAVGFAGGSLNLFAYVSNDPINYYDRTGFFKEPSATPKEAKPYAKILDFRKGAEGAAKSSARFIGARFLGFIGFFLDATELADTTWPKNDPNTNPGGGGGGGSSGGNDDDCDDDCFLKDSDSYESPGRLGFTNWHMFCYYDCGSRDGFKFSQYECEPILKTSDMDLLY